MKATRPSAMLGAERHRQMHRRLLERGSIRVAEEARLFGVSEETIRRDIKVLQAEGIAEAVFGGAILRAQPALGPVGVPPVDERGRIEHEAKTAIGAAAAELIEPGQVVIVDAGTTTLAAAQHLRRHRGLRIITNSLVIAQVAASFPEAVVYVIGGKLVAESMSMVGPQAQRDLAALSADWAILGTAAVDAEAGFTSAEPYEAEVKRAMIRAARRSMVLADRTKLTSRGFVSFAAPGEVDMLVTCDPPEAALRRLQEAGMRVRVCSGASPVPAET